MSFFAKILSSLLAFPTYHADVGDDRKRDQLVTIANAVEWASGFAGYPGPRPELAGLLVAVGWHESTYALNVHVGQCRPTQCDRGRSRTPWQLQRWGPTHEVWDDMVGLDPAATRIAALEAARRLTYARHACRRAAGDPIQLTLTAYAGRGCRLDWPGALPRVQTYQRVLAKLR